MATLTRNRKPLQPVHGVCRWSRPLDASGTGWLIISGTDYLVAVLDTTASFVRRAFALTKDEGTVYHVAEHTDGIFRCDCPDAIYREERPGGCKHARGLAAALKAIGK